MVMGERSEFWKKEVVYQIYPRSFCDSNNDGIGDIQGIINKLEHIKELGAGVVWLSPLYASPNDDNGYDISDYYSINSEFGTMTDMDELILRARELGLKLIMDLVVNHTSDEHEWFKDAISNKNSPYRDYYIFKEGKGKDFSLPPNNWTSFFTGSAWERVEGTNEYYLHLFSKKQPDLNFANQRVVEEVKDIMRFWLDKGISGFRCDVINLIGKKDFLDGIKKGGITGVDKFISTSRCHEVLRELKSEVLNNYDSFTVGETVFVTTDLAKDLCKKDRGELDMVFSFEHMETDQIFHKWFRTRFKFKPFLNVLAKWQRELDWNANYFENHDQTRSTTRFLKTDEPKNAKSLAVLLLSLRGTPYIYQGQEIGMTNGDFQNMSEIQDIESHRVNKIAQNMHFPKWLRWKMIKKSSRDNARTPMQWNNKNGAGFCDDGEKAWLKINSNHEKINVTSQLSDPNSLLNFYKKMIAFRRDNNVLLKGDFKLIKASNRHVEFTRTLDDSTLTIVCNFSNRPLKHKYKQKILLSTHDNLKEGAVPPYGAIIY